MAYVWLVARDRNRRSRTTRPDSLVRASQCGLNNVRSPGGANLSSLTREAHVRPSGIKLCGQQFGVEMNRKSFAVADSAKQGGTQACVDRDDRHRIDSRVAGTRDSRGDA